MQEVALSLCNAPIGYVPDVCTSFSYSAWGKCTNGVHSRVATGVPAGCVGSPDTSQLFESCKGGCPADTSDYNSLIGKLPLGATTAPCMVISSPNAKLFTAFASSSAGNKDSCLSTCDDYFAHNPSFQGDSKASCFFNGQIIEGSDRARYDYCESSSGGLNCPIFQKMCLPPTGCTYGPPYQKTIDGCEVGCGTLDCSGCNPNTECIVSLGGQVVGSYCSLSSSRVLLTDLC